MGKQSLMKYLHHVFIIILLIVSSGDIFAQNGIELDDDGNPIIRFESAPNWSVVHNEEGIRAEDFEGKPYVLHFWSSWSPYCTEFQPGLHSMAMEYKNDGIETLAISFWENSRANPTQVLLDRGYKFRSIINGDEVAKLFNIQLPPTTIFINGDNEIIKRLVIHDPNDPKIRAAYEELKESM